MLVFTAVGRVFSLGAVFGLLTAVASLVAEHGSGHTQVSAAAAPRLESTGSVVAAHTFICSAACRMFLRRDRTCVLCIDR